MTTAEIRKAWGAATRDERNALVAEGVMRWEQRLITSTLGHHRMYWAPTDGSQSVCPLVDSFNPVESIADAWEAVEKLDAYVNGYKLRLERDSSGWAAYFLHGDEIAPLGVGVAAPEAICLAALLATAED